MNHSVTYFFFKQYCKMTGPLQEKATAPVLQVYTHRYILPAFRRVQFCSIAKIRLIRLNKCMAMMGFVFFNVVDDTSWRFKEEPRVEAAWNPPWTAQPLPVGVGDTDTWCIRLCAARTDISHLRSRLHGWINKRRVTAGTVKRFI